MILDHVEPVDMYAEMKLEYGKAFIEQLEEYEEFEREFAKSRGYVELGCENYYQQSDVELNALLECGEGE